MHPRHVSTFTVQVELCQDYPLCVESCLCCSCAGSQGTATERKVSSLGTSGSRLCFLQMMSFCRCLQAMTFSIQGIFLNTFFPILKYEPQAHENHVGQQILTSSRLPQDGEPESVCVRIHACVSESEKKSLSSRFVLIK